VSPSPLENLVRIGQLKRQEASVGEAARLLAMARTRLADAQQMSVSLEGRFSSAYTSAHLAAMAALRRQGLRSENRYIVFQCLEHTAGWPAARWRVLAAAHDVRNRAEYEGFVEVDERRIDELIELAGALIEDVQTLAGIG
jgi:hypothetical protein